MERHDWGILLQIISIVFLMIFVLDPFYFGTMGILAAILIQVVIMLNTLGIKSMKKVDKMRGFRSEITMILDKMRIEDRGRAISDRLITINQMANDASMLRNVTVKYSIDQSISINYYNPILVEHIPLVGFLKRNEEKEFEENYIKYIELHDKMHFHLQGLLKLM